MSIETVNQMVMRLSRAEALAAEHFEVLLGTPLKRVETNSYWTTFTFELAEGPFGRGELRLNAAGDGAVLILEPRDPPGLGVADIDRAALGTRLDMRPNIHVPPEGIITEHFVTDGVEVAVQWTSRSRRLRNLVLEWAPAAAAAPAPGEADGINPN